MQSAKRHEREASTLRDRIAELEPRLNRSQQVSSTVQKQSEQQQMQSNELLLQVFMDLNKFLGVEVRTFPLDCVISRPEIAVKAGEEEQLDADDRDHHTPSEFSAFRETLLSRLQSVNRSKGEAEKRIKEQETQLNHRMGYVYTSLLLVAE